MGEIVETDDGKYKAINDNGEELEDSPFDSEEAVKIALNRAKIRYDAGEEEEDDQDDQDDEDDEKDTDQTSSQDGQEQSSGFGVPLKVGVIALATVLLITWMRDSSDPEVEQEQEDQGEEKQEEDRRKSASDLF